MGKPPGALWCRNNWFKSAGKSRRQTTPIPCIISGRLKEFQPPASFFTARTVWSKLSRTSSGHTFLHKRLHPLQGPCPSRGAHRRVPPGRIHAAGHDRQGFNTGSFSFFHKRHATRQRKIRDFSHGSQAGIILRWKMFSIEVIKARQRIFLK